MRADPDPFDPSHPVRPLAPRTIQLRRQQLRLAAAALVEKGRDPATVTSLAELVEPDAFKDILRQLLADHGGEPNTWSEGVGKALIATAREWVRQGEDKEAELKRLFARLPKARPGMTDRNRKILRELRDEATLARLIFLPDALFQEALKAAPDDKRAALKAQLSVAIDILLATGMRSANLIERCVLAKSRSVPAPSGML